VANARATESPRTDDKKRRIVEAATVLFTRYGFKRTSVDLLAAEAEVAKPTVYAHFKDKDAIFRAVVESVCDELLAAAKLASQSEAPIEERLAAMLSEKFTRHWQLAHASPHARELLDSQGSLGEAIVQRADRAYLALLVGVLESAERSSEIDPRRAGHSPVSAAALLLRAASGANYDATSAAAHRKHLAEIVRLIVGAFRPARGARRP
jgi:AcrR family transcriptional regulator